MSPWIAFLIFAGIASALVLPAMFLGRWAPRRRDHAAAAPAPVVPPAESWDSAAELSRLIDGDPEVSALYGRLGHPPELERSVGRILSELRALIRAEVPDFAAFEAALSAAEGQGAEAGEQDRELLAAVLRARGDREEALRLLNEDPVSRLLPFVEQLPLVRNGEVTWRTPVELTVIRKRPSDPERFERLLEELERLVRSSRLRRRESLRAALLEAISRARRDALRPGAYMPTSVKTLEAAARDWLDRAEDPAARGKREQLDGLLRESLGFRHAPGRPAEAPRAYAQLYAGSPWMHTPSLTSRVLTDLLDAELALLPAGKKESPASPPAVLRRVRDEVASGHFDGDETARRLRQQEEAGVYVHSLVYALLRMSRLPSAPSGDSGSAARFPKPPEVL